MGPNTETYLTRAAYAQEKRRICIEFSNRSVRETRTYKFFPSAFLPLVPRKSLDEALSRTGDKRHFVVERSGGSLKVSASTFSELQEFCSGLGQATGKKHAVIGPERQFLLERGWSYFDCFAPGEETEERAECNQPFGAVLEALGQPVDEVIAKLKNQKGEVLAVMEKIALSSLLNLPVAQIPESAKRRAEVFVENSLFRSGAPIPACGDEGWLFGEGRLQHGQAMELDFSEALLEYGSLHKLNIGVDSLNCGCCKPSGAGERNIAPSSMARVRFLADGTFFDSKSKRWAESFHNAEQGKESRLNRQREWCLGQVPAGPFNRNETAEVPLADALALESEGRAEMLGFGTCITWFCRQKESALQEGIAALRERIVLLDDELKEMERAEFTRSGIMAQELLGNDPAYAFRAVMRDKARELLGSAYLPLVSRGSALFNAEISDAVKTLMAALLADFREFAERRGMLAVEGAGSRLMVRGGNALSIINGFSLQKAASAPRIAHLPQRTA